VSRRGGERLFEEMASLFPEAGISTLFLRRETLTPAMAARRWQVSPLGGIAPRFVDHRKLLPLYPWALRRMRVPAGTELLLTSEAALIKGLRKPPGCMHVCYCHSPARYLWDMADEYASQSAGMGGPGRWLFRKVLPRLRRFDREAAMQVDHFIANSRFVAERIRRIYGREAEVIYPPVDVARFSGPDEPPGDYFFIVSEQVSYKRVDIAVDACARSGRKLVVAGDGPERRKLETLAGPTVQFVGRVNDAEVVRLMRGCRAFLHPQIEDFGIAAVEAQAAGRPVIAYRGGGAMETVREGETGLFFDEQTPESLIVALARFDAAPDRISSVTCRAQAARFSAERFRMEVRAFVERVSPWACAGQ
jgi:glycosyltransferase involved in cell wall biosynthesis